MRVIDENGNQLGVMDTSQALRTARDRGYDLIEVSPNSDPPVWGGVGSVPARDSGDGRYSTPNAGAVR